MSTFYFIRHGANDMLGKSIAGWQAGVHLNKEGREQAERLANYLGSHPIQRIYSSPLERARETAQPLAKKLNLEIQNTSELGEVQFGDWNGATLEDLDRQHLWKQWNSFRTGTRIPNGEMMIVVQARMATFLQKLREDFTGHTVALFSHGDPIRAALAYYLGIPLDYMLRFEVDPASVSVLSITDAGPRVLSMNDVTASR
jgi:probable phosphomutase (TIGR03848 family)